MKWLSSAFSVLCGFLAIQIIVTAWSVIATSSHLETRDYITFVGMLITFITAVLLATFNFAVTRSNTQLTARLNRESAEAIATFNSESAATLAKLKADLDVETAKSVERIRSEFTKSVNEAADRMRFEFNKTSEDFKARLGQTIPQRYNGYHMMFRAATKYFFAIRRLEEGIYPSEDLKDASKAADEATGTALVVDADDRAKFFDFVRESHFIAQTAKDTLAGEPLIQLWEKEGKKYGQSYNTLEGELSVKVRT